MLMVKVVLLVLSVGSLGIWLSIQDFLAGGATVGRIVATASGATNWLVGDICHHGGMVELFMLVISVLHSVPTRQRCGLLIPVSR